MNKSRTPWTPEEDAVLTELYYKNLMPAEISAQIGRSVASVDTRRRKLGLDREFRFEKVPAPDDLRERARTMSVSQLVEFYDRSRSVISRWLHENKIPHIIGRRGKAIPKNFAFIAKTKTQAELARFYGTDPRTVRGWCLEVNVEPMTHRDAIVNRAQQLEKEAKEKAHEARREFSTKTKMVAADAAHYLRRYYRNVFRTDILMFEQSSKTWGDAYEIQHRGFNQYYVEGKGVLWLDDLIALAEARGFKQEGM